MNITMITAGKVSIDKKPDGAKIHVDIAEAKGAPIIKHFHATPYSLETNGAVVESYGPHGVTIEVFGFDEFQARFAALAKENPKLFFSGFCALKSNGPGNYYCDKGTCNGTCTLHNIPVYCSCG